MQPLLKKEVSVLKSTTPNLSDQQRFWNRWNASQRDPGKLNQRTLNRGETIIELVRSLGLDNPKILDFGCGTGWLSERIAQFGPVTGVDLAADVIAAAQSRAPHVKFLAGDLFLVPLPNAYYDIVVSQEVIAHIPNQKAYLDRVANLLKPTGYLILTTPNKFVMKRSDWPPQPAEHIERWLSMADLKRLLRLRFRILSMSTVAPLGHRGILRLVNSYKINTVLGKVISKENLESLKERAGYGYTIIVLARLT
jgi:2-polyprenyl-3-methyl-5-hydroxy-6-metoxy-1,4-benzoquinol methylase